MRHIHKRDVIAERETAVEERCGVVLLRAGVGGGVDGLRLQLNHQLRELVLQFGLELVLVGDLLLVLRVRRVFAVRMRAEIRRAECAEAHALQLCAAPVALLLRLEAEAELREHLREHVVEHTRHVLQVRAQRREQQVEQLHRAVEALF